jgi:hypothetical protein
MTTDPITLLLLGLYGLAVSWAEERNEVFQNWSPGTKQIVNGVLAFAIPAVVSFLSNFWRAEFGSVESFASFAVLTFGPALVVWVSSQVSHAFDRVLNVAGDKPAGYMALPYGVDEEANEVDEMISVGAATVIFQQVAESMGIPDLVKQSGPLGSRRRGSRDKQP